VSYGWSAALVCIEADSVRQLFPEVLLFRYKESKPLTLLFFLRQAAEVTVW
jgi:hypothetical protein